MKKFAYASVLALALVAMIANVAFAGAGHQHGKKAAMGECCITAAEAGKGCCGKDAETVKASYADYKATTAVKADMHKCCAGALAKGEGCCGKDAAALKADYTKKVASYKVASGVKADMHKCCAAALGKGEGCCGKEAGALKADYDKKVVKAEKKLASK